MPKVLDLAGVRIEADISNFARQADGSVWLKCGNNVALSTVACEISEEEYQGFFPLTVECRNRPAAAGKIPGGYLKREGKLSDTEVLLSRLIDRSVRPHFPRFFAQDTQLITTLMSHDGSFPIEVLAILASSIALSASCLPFQGPVAAVMFGRKAGQEWKLNPSYAFMQEASDQVLLVGMDTGICMVEATCDFVSNEELLSLMDQAVDPINKQLEWQKEIKAEANRTVRDYPHEKLQLLVTKIEEVFPAELEQYVFAEDKATFEAQMSSLKKLIKEQFLHDIVAGKWTESEFDICYDVVKKERVPNVVTRAHKRFDLRAFDQIRNINSKIDLLPVTHGSGLFTRGQTQALCSLSLGAGADAQKVDNLMHVMEEKTFMLHYNFPPFCTGQVKPLRGVGRREIGHGFLAEKSFKHVLPKKADFPYTIRALVDILESNGSSSMACVCAVTLAMLDGGVPLRRMTSGIAMGLLEDESGKFSVLSDITGAEDSYGIMDLKVVGDENGICAIQLDIKHDQGIPRQVFVDALSQAQKGRAHILDKMRECIKAPKPELKENAPRVYRVKINQGKIAAVIGPSGKYIKEIVADTGTQIDIADDGIVTIFARDRMSARKAESWVRALSGDIKVGSSYAGKITKVTDFGMFVAIVPGKEGLLHNSTISKNKRDLIGKTYKAGVELPVVVLSYDPEIGRISLAAPELESSDESFD